MKTIIHSNGSKWGGEKPDNIATLKTVLKNNPLDSTFEDYGDFVYEDDNIKGKYWLFGNFKNLSHVFRIETTDINLVNEIRLLVNENKKRPDYGSEWVRFTSKNEIFKR